jgi:GNAT superfamily N-acetyltransferase
MAAVVTLEELDESNHDDVRRLVLGGLEEHWGSLDLTRNPDLADMLTAFEGGRTVVARDERGSVVGTGTLVRRGDGTGEIVRMSVDRSVRRLGLGRILVDELLTTARSWSLERVVLETTSAWTDVVRFYESCGFTPTHVDGSDTWFELALER